LLRHSSHEVNDVFLSTRNPGVLGAWGSHYGTLAVTVTQPLAKTVMERAIVSD
jgi:putative acyl-CoA dehydrogenase